MKHQPESLVDKEFFRLETPHLTLEGRSRAGHETFFRIRELGIALDLGRGPDLVISMPHVFVTHAHLDHAAGIAFYASQRRLQSLEAAAIHVPSESAEDFRALLAIQERLTGAAFDLEIVGMSAGDEVRCGRSHFVRAHDSSHRVATRAWEVIDQRHHLREELFGLDPAEIARRRRAGEVVDEQYRRSLLFYTGDTDRRILELGGPLFESEVLVIECSFVAEGHQERAEKYRHIHVDDIAEFASSFRNELVVLSHFSRRYSREEIRSAVRRRIPTGLRDRIRLALPEPWQRL